MLRKITILLSALAVMVVMSVPAYAKNCTVVGEFVICNNGHQLDDNLDHDQGGGNNHIKLNNRGGNHE